MSDPLEGVKATADAAKETAKTVGIAIEAGRDAGRWLDGRLSTVLDDAIGLAFGDQLAFARTAANIRRSERLASLAKRTKERLHAMGVETVSPIPDRVALPLLQAASLEDDPNLQEMWANLLARALESDEGIDQAFVAILRDLTPVGALALKDYYLRVEGTLRPPWKESGYTFESGSLDGDYYGVDVTRTLFRLGLVEPARIVFSVVREVSRNQFDDVDSTPVEITVPGDLFRIKLTELGEHFCEAVGIRSLEPPQTPV